jgi:hypothetical protein
MITIRTWSDLVTNVNRVSHHWRHFLIGLRYNAAMSDTALIQFELPNVPADIAVDALAIATMVAQGRTLTQACRKHGVETFTVLGWRKKYPEIDATFAQATEYWSHAKADELMDLPDRGLNPAVMRTHSENIKWLLGNRNSKDYGSKPASENQVQGALVDALQQAIQRIPRPNTDLDNIITIQPIDITGE